MKITEAVNSRPSSKGIYKGSDICLFGIWKGKIWMSDSFDKSLEDLKDYM
ncbi:MAG TPA: DUF2281 domain-containing protein [Kamptonema sp.]|nr:DUF2281 domain-containing protein [Kamptonema sp.]